jgi:hypothetical protein
MKNSLMGTTLISEPISTQQLREAGEELYGDMVKAVVDVEKGVMAVGAELHADEEAFLLERNSRQENLWGSTCIRTAQWLKWWKRIIGIVRNLVR